MQSSAMLVRRAAAEAVGWLDPDFFVYSDETDFCRRLHDAGGRILFVPDARAIHHDQLSTDPRAMERRIVEFHRNRDLYFRKHRMPLTRWAWRICWTWAYAVRAARRAGAARPRPAPLLAACAPAAAAWPRRGNPGGGRAPQRAPGRRLNRAQGAAQSRDGPRRRIRCRAVEHADTAQLAALGGALGSVLVLLGRGPTAAARSGWRRWRRPRSTWRRRSAPGRSTSSARRRASVRQCSGWACSAPRPRCSCAGRR